MDIPVPNTCPVVVNPPKSDLTIHIRLVEKHPEGSHCVRRSHDENIFQIILDKNQGYDLLCALTHEIGHVVAHYINLPANGHLLRPHGAGKLGDPEVVLQAEFEAWRVAQLIFTETRNSVLARAKEKIEMFRQAVPLNFGDKP
jgi:hypothetical protein